MNIGFIGCGNMATAIIKGIVGSGVVKGEDICAYDPNNEAVNNAALQFSIKKCENANEVVEYSDFVVLAVKPNMLTPVITEINAKLEGSKKVLVSIAAGKTIEYIRDKLSHDNKIVRVMPNINAMVGSACSAYCANAKVTNTEKKKIEKIFGSIGEITELPESSFPLFGVIAGSAPAFAYMFIDALARAGVKNGMKKETALNIAAQTVLGSARMILESGTHPYALIDQVCSPGGTTIEGVTSLQADGFEAAVHNAVDKALEKDSKL